MEPCVLLAFIGFYGFLLSLMLFLNGVAPLVTYDRAALLRLRPPVDVAGAARWEPHGWPCCCLDCPCAPLPQAMMCRPSVRPRRKHRRRRGKQGSRRVRRLGGSLVGGRVDPQNDVGYAVMVVASHQKERERTGSQSPLMANKDAFTRYSLAYPEFAEAVRFRQAFEEARVKSLQPGQEEQALVGFGDFKFESLQSLYDSKDPQKIRFVSYLRRTPPAPGSQIENAVRYVRKRDRQREGTTSTTSSTPVAASSSSCSSVCLSVLPGAEGCISICSLCVWAAFSVCGGNAGQTKKDGGPKPAFISSFRSARPSTASGEPSDGELVQAVADQGGNFLNKSETCHLQRDSDDSAVVGFMRDGQEDRELVDHFVAWCGGHSHNLECEQNK